MMLKPVLMNVDVIQQINKPDVLNHVLCKSWHQVSYQQIQLIDVQGPGLGMWHCHCFHINFLLIHNITNKAILIQRNIRFCSKSPLTIELCCLKKSKSKLKK